MQHTSSSPHHCVGFLFFAWIPPLLPLPPPRPSAAQPLTTHHSPTSHTSLITAQLININHLTYHSTTHHSSTSHTSLIILSQHNSSQLRVSRLPFAWQAQYTEPPGVVAAGAAAAFRVAGAVHGARGRRCAKSAATDISYLTSHQTYISHTDIYHITLLVSRLISLNSSLSISFSCSRLRRRRLIITTHHSSTYHITISHHNSSQLITTYHIPTHHSSTSHRSTSHHFSQVHFSSQLITTYHIPTHHSSTSHTTSHTSLLTPHFSHLPEVHIKTLDT